MRSAALIIHEGLSDLSATKTSLKDVVGILDGGKRLDDSILELDLAICHSDFQLWSILGILWQQEITELALVDLNHVAGELDFVLLHVTNNGIELIDRSRGQTGVGLISLNREGLSRSSLSVCEDAYVVAIDSTLDEALGLIEHLNLC